MGLQLAMSQIKHTEKAARIRIAYLPIEVDTANLWPVINGKY